MAEPYIPIRIELPMRLYLPLARRAEGRGYDTIAAMMVAMLERSVDVSWDADGLAAMVAEGLSDAEIATQTGELVNRVADHRRALGLPPNRRYKDRGPR